MLMARQSKKHNLATGFNFFYAAAQFLLSTVTVSAESVDAPTPAVRVTWSTTAPPQCVASVTVEFRTQSIGSAATTNTTTNTSQTEVIQTGLLCTTYYNITVKVTGTMVADGNHPTKSSRKVQVFVGGNKIVYTKLIYSNFMLAIPLHRYIHTSWSES